MMVNKQHFSVISVINCLNSLNKRHILADWIKETESNNLLHLKRGKRKKLKLVVKCISRHCLKRQNKTKQKNSSNPKKF